LGTEQEKGQKKIQLKSPELLNFSSRSSSFPLLHSWFFLAPRLEVARRALGPIEERGAGFGKKYAGVVREFTCKAVENLVKGIARLRRAREQHGLLHGGVGQQALLLQHLLRANAGQESVQHGYVLLRHEHANLLPGYGIRERKHDVIGNDDGDATENHAFHQPGTPGRPSQWTQAENGALHVLVVGSWMVCGDVEQWVVLEILPNGCSCTPEMHVLINPHSSVRVKKQEKKRIDQSMKHSALHVEECTP